LFDLGDLREKYTDAEPIPSARAGVLLRARHQDLARRVLIRVLPRVSEAGSGEHQALFQRGARAAAGLIHPNILQVLDYQTTDDANLLVLEDVEGEPLDSLLARDQALPPERALPIARQLADALDLAHQRGRVHRNLRPAEVLLTPGGQVKLGGFEAAALPPDPEDRWQADPLLGNALYIAPEQVLGQPVTERSDLYSLGVLLYLMLTGQPPVAGTRSWAVLYKKTSADPPPPSEVRAGVPEAVDALVLRLLRRAPEERFASMAEFRQALDALGKPTPGAEDAGLAPLVAGPAHPFPVAHADRLIWRDLDWLPRLQRLLYAFESAIKYCASVALLGRAAPLTGEPVKALGRPSLGHWVNLLRLATLDAPAAPVQLHGQLAQFTHGGGGTPRGLDFFDRAVQARNRVAHGALSQERDCQATFDALLPDWRGVLAGLNFLGEFPLGKVLRIRYADRRFVVAYRSYMGDNPAFRTEETTLADPLAEGAFGVLDPAGSGMLELTPLVQARECGKCGDEEVFFFNGLRGAKHDLLSYQKGHMFLADGPANAFQRRGLVL
jgi:hypothetical protein